MKLTKICPKCNKEKELQEFHKNKNKKDGLQILCKSCRKLHSANYYILNKVKIDKRTNKYNKDNYDLLKQKRKKYNNLNKEKLNLRYKEYRTNNKDKIKKYYNENKNKFKEKERKLRKTYNLTLDEWYQILKSQYYQCNICNKLFDLDNIRDIQVDHDHNYKYKNLSLKESIRSILCNNCNNILKGFEKHKDVELWILLNSIKYLNKIDTEYKYYDGNIWKKYHSNEYYMLINKCNNKCEICQIEFIEQIPCIDHNHSTGYIRGILCRICNTRLGKAKDNKFILQNAKIYLEEHIK